MTTSRYNQHKRRRIRLQRDAERRRHRRTGGDFKYRNGLWKPRPNTQYDREDQGKERR